MTKKANSTKKDVAIAAGAAAIAMIPLSKILPAETNVRKGPYPNLESLASTIVEIGLQQSLNVEPVDKDQYRVVAGSRRYAAMQLALEDGRLSGDYQVPCIVDDNKVVSLEERQLVENIERCPLNPVDEYEAFAQIITDEKATPAQLATRFGTTERHIKQRLRLGTLADPIREALRKGEMTLDVAMAYGTVSDQERQINAFQALSNFYHVSAFQVKRAVTEASYDSDHPLAVFVGVDEYAKKGGAVEDDLFEEGLRLTDAPLLQSMALKKLQAIADDIKAKEEWGWAEGTIDGVHRFAGEDIRINSYTRAFSEEEQKEYDDITGKLLDMEDQELTDEQAQEYENLEARLEEITQEATSYNAAEKAIAGVWVGVDQNGQLEISRGWVRADDAKRLQVLHSTGEDKEEGKKDKKEPEAKPLNQMLVDDLTGERIMAVRLALVENPQHAINLAIYTMARKVEREETNFVSMYFEPASCESSHRHSFKAHTPIIEAREKLNRSWCGKSFYEGFLAFSDLPEADKQAWAAMAMQRQITSSGWWTNGKTTDFDQMAGLLEADIRKTFTPDAEFIERMTKPQLLQMAEDLGGKDLKNDLDGLKKGELVSALAGIFDGSATVYGDGPIEKAKTWLPKNMAFPKPVKKAPAKKATAQKTTANKAKAKRGTKAAAKATASAKKALAKPAPAKKAA